MSQEDLDKLFQQNSEDYDFEYNSEAWSQMEDLLEEDDRRRFFWWWFFGIGLLVIGLIGFVFFKYSGIVSTTDQIEILDESPIPHSTDQETISNALTNESEKKEGKEVNTHVEENKETEANDSNSFSASEISKAELKDGSRISTTDGSSGAGDNFVGQRNSGANENSNNVASNSISNASPSNTDLSVSNSESTNSSDNNSTNTQSIDQQKDETGSSIVNNTKTSGEDGDGSIILVPTNSVDGEGNILQKKKNNEEEEQPISNVLPLAQLPIPLLTSDSTMNLPELYFSNIEKTDEGDDGGNVNDNMWLVGILGGVESSTVKLKEFSKISLKYGLHTEFRFSKKYSIGLGANFVEKLYAAGDGEYTPPVGFWTNDVAANLTNGEFEIFEVPVSFSYFKKGFRQNGFYGSIGLTSYILSKERYFYFYQEPDPALRQKWRTAKANKHWFGIGQLSFGYQRFFSSRFSFQIEPYVQLPIAKLGHGKVSVATIGLSSKINFRIK